MQPGGSPFPLVVKNITPYLAQTVMAGNAPLLLTLEDNQNIDGKLLTGPLSGYTTFHSDATEYVNIALYAITDQRPAGSKSDQGCRESHEPSYRPKEMQWKNESKSKTPPPRMAYK